MRPLQVDKNNRFHPGSERLPELDGLRGCAILLVLVWHYLQAYADTPLATLGSRLRLGGWDYSPVVGAIVRHMDSIALGQL